MNTNELKLSAFIVPIVFSALGFFYKDSFYFFIALITLLVGLSIVIPKKRLTVPSVVSKTLKKGSVLLRWFKFPKLKRVKKITIKIPKKQQEEASFSRKKEIVSTALVIGVSTVLFAAGTIFLLPEAKSTAPIILQYYLSYLALASSYTQYLAALGGIGLLTLFGYIMLKRKRYTMVSLAKQLAVRTAIYLAALGVSFHLALGAAFLYATGQVSYITYGYNKGFVTNTIVSDAKEISKKIQNEKVLPKMVYYNYPYKKSLVLLTLKSNKGFYAKTITTNLPNSLYASINVPSAAMYLVDNQLLITELKEEVLETLSPTLGKILVKSTFKNNNIKDKPKISLLNRQEYLKLREDQINKEIEKLEENLAAIDQEIRVAQGYIATGRKDVQEAEAFLANANSLIESRYNECKTAGETYFGEFYRYYTDDQCNAMRAEWENSVREVSNQLPEMKSVLAHNQQVVAENQSVRKYIEDAREFVDATKDSTPHELGLFLPNEEIKIALDSNNPDVFNAYLATLAHEYLHYTSYVSEERRLNHFFEEALTEYFARKVLKEQLGYTENVGYPVAVQLITEMTKKISEKELLAIYFTKDQKQLEYLLNDAYGKNFYADSEYFFSIINYLPPEESLKTANTIMVRIDGKKISQASIL